MMTTVTISLPQSLKSFAESQLATKGYGNMSEYFRTLLRRAQEEETIDPRLEKLLLEGLEEGGKDIPVDEKFWKDLRKRTDAIAKTAKRKRK